MLQVHYNVEYKEIILFFICLCESHGGNELCTIKYILYLILQIKKHKHIK